MDNLARKPDKTDFELRLYRERKRQRREDEERQYIRNQRFLGTVLIVASLLTLPVHQEGMLVVFCLMLGIMPWIPE